MTTFRPEPTAISHTEEPQSVAAPLNTASQFSQGNKQRKTSIRLLVMTSFVVPTITAVGLTGWLSIQNGQKAVTELAGRLQNEVGNRVSAHLDSYLSVPHQINRINLDAVELGAFSLQDFQTLGKYFWKQMRVFNIGYINYANPQGEFIGVERLDNDRLLINEVSLNKTQGKLYVYQTNDDGDRTKLESTKTYDPRSEAWYTDAVRVGRPIWSKIYQWDDKPEVLSISSSYPIYTNNNKFLGVIGIDLILSQISSFLNQLDISPSARIFIVESNGLIVANSGKAQAYTVMDDKPQRLSAENSSDERIRAAAQYLKKSFGGVEKIQTRQLLHFKFNGERQFVQVTPWKDKWGLDWRIVMVISESDFMAQINANTQNTILLCGIALLVSIFLGFVTSRWITDPVVRLSQASQAIADGNLNQTVDIDSVGELDILAQSFNQMAQQLRQSFATLEQTNQELEQRVTERTATLYEESQTLQQEVGHLLDVVSAVEDGDLTIEAQVSPYVTGLVADTLNRLIERLGHIMATVFKAAERVTQEAEQLGRLAVTVAEDAQEQTHSAALVQTLMENINALSQDAASQAVATGEAVELTRSAIDQGQQEILTMTQGINVLQQNTHQIVKRTQTLTNYVELAAQFAKDQKRIAAMTRVLAVNASMLATRASSQQEPEQLIAINREFETIAVQVNQLATQTNQSLMLLQQRTDQIQTVVSGLNHDVEEISQQVSNFTLGVEQSQQAFNTIQSVSERVAQMGQQVTQSSQAIVDATETTLQSVHHISNLSMEVLNRADETREQAQQMEQLARLLLQKVEFFRLRPEQLPASDIAESSVLTVAPAPFSQNGASSR